MVNFYTTKTRFREALIKEINRIKNDPVSNAGDGRLLLSENDKETINGLLLQHGFSKRIMKTELELFGLEYDEEKSIITKR